MTSRNIHHVPVVEDAAILGLVASTDLLRLERTDPIHLVGEVARATDVATLAALARRLPRIVEQLVGAGASASTVGRIVTAVGDAVEQRLLALAEQRLGPAPTAYAWVVLGSQARLEQGPGSDQDNALVLSDDATADDAAWFEALATFVVDGLAACGYRRCPGDVMATNPRWRRPEREWRAMFSRWMDEPVPDAVLGSAIFFDLRVLHGDPRLVERLQEHVCRTAPTSSRFLAHLARSAAENEPPLGFFRGLVLERRGEHRETLDLKRGGVHAIVEVARVHALALGLPQVGTVPRLAAASAAGGLSTDSAADLRDAFEFIQGVRLLHQARQLREGQEPDSFMTPTTLSGFDKRHLRDAFAIVRTAQLTLLQSHPLGHLA